MPRRKIEYLKSLGQFLVDLGARDGYIIGDEKGKESIDWVRLAASQLDREITIHPEFETPLRRAETRPDGSEIVENPTFSTKEEVQFSLLSARYQSGEEDIVVTCNIRIKDTCQTARFSVQELRNRLGVMLPTPFRQWLYAHM